MDVNKIKGRSVLYSGIILDEESRERLVKELGSLLEPLIKESWLLQNKPGLEAEPLPHHHTLIFGQGLPEDLKKFLGTEQELVAHKWGHSDKAAAVMVRCDLRSANKIPHVTVAISPSGKPFHSNDIPESNWVSLEREIRLTGIVQEVV